MNLRDIAHLAETIQPVLILAGGIWALLPLQAHAQGGGTPVRVITGHQRSWRSRAFKDDAYWWGSFFYIDPHKLDKTPLLTESATS